jgi:hypothetical protein
MSNNEVTTFFQQIEEYKQQNPVIEETMQIYREVQPIYEESMRIIREAELAMYNYRIITSSNTEREAIEHWEQYTLIEVDRKVK